MSSSFIRSISQNNMGKEVRTYFNSQTEDPRYLPFKIERNGSIAMRIARHMGLPYNPHPLMAIDQNEPSYVVPGVTLTVADALGLHIRDEMDLYGTAVTAFDMVGKSILHPSIDVVTPSFYDSAFAKKVEAECLVLPGLTGFSSAALLDAYRAIGSPETGYRLKRSNESDGNGQHEVRGLTHLKELLTKTGEEILNKQGVVLEPNLKDRMTQSAGFFNLGGEQYVFVADQLSGDDDRYMGGENILVARGEMEALHDLLKRQGDPRSEIVAKAGAFLGEYFSHFPSTIASRMSVDILSGSHPHYGYLSGVTDITGRLGGLCPGTILAAQQLQDHPSQEAAIAEVRLNYEPSVRQPYEENATVFMDQAPLRITSKIVKVI